MNKFLEKIDFLNDRELLNDKEFFGKWGLALMRILYGAIMILGLLTIILIISIIAQSPPVLLGIIGFFLVSWGIGSLMAWLFRRQDNG